jgi:hypothetical protein
MSYAFDHCLNVPFGSIPQGVSYTIRGKLKLPKERFIQSDGCQEEFISPIMEFHVDGDHKFLKPVKVVIYSAVVKSLDKKKLRVYLEHNGRKEILEYKENYSEFLNSKQLWYSIEDGAICVYTYHFTNIFCTMCEESHEEENINRITGIITASLFNKNDGCFGLDLELFLQVFKTTDDENTFFNVRRYFVIFKN